MRADSACIKNRKELIMKQIPSLDVYVSVYIMA